MANLAKWIEDAANGVPIENVVIGEMENRHRKVPLPTQRRGELLSWAEAKPMLDYEFYPEGYGPPDCNAVYVWTTTKVMFITQYDGATSLHWVPRNPIPVMPEMPGE